MWWDLYRQHYYKCSPDSDSEISLKIGQYLMKLRRNGTKMSVFFGPACSQQPVYHAHDYCSAAAATSKFIADTQQVLGNDERPLPYARSARPSYLARWSTIRPACSPPTFDHPFFITPVLQDLLFSVFINLSTASLCIVVIAVSQCS